MKYAALTAVLLTGILFTTSNWSSIADGEADTVSTITLPELSFHPSQPSSAADADSGSTLMSVRSQILTVAPEPPLAPSAPRDEVFEQAQQGELEYDATILQLRSQLHGIARPQQNAVMSSLVPGRIMTVHVSEGDVVEQGAELISLDDRLAQAQVAAARIEAQRIGAVQRAELAFLQAQRQFERLQKAALKTPTAGFEIEEVRSMMQQAEAAWTASKEAQQVAEANLELAQQNLLRNTVNAPFDGLVVQIHQQPGVTVDPSIPLITLANLEHLEAEMYVPVQRFGQLNVGGTVQIRAGAPVDALLSATVKSVSPVIDSASQTFRCVLQIENPTGNLPAGFAVSLESSSGPPSSDLAVSPLSFQ